MLSKTSQLLDASTIKTWEVLDPKEKKYYTNIATYAYEVLSALVGIEKTRRFIKETRNNPDLYNKMADYAYYLEDFYLRSYLFREKLYKLINVSLLGLSQKNKYIPEHIKASTKIRDISDVLDKLYQDKVIKKVFDGRRSLTHRYLDVLKHNKDVIDNYCKDKFGRMDYQKYYKYHSRIQSKEITYVTNKFWVAANKISGKILHKVGLYKKTRKDDLE